jgi:acylphosphatase
MEETVRAHATITGLVQGVFFRLQTQRAAEQSGVAGWVRNRPDGSVEAVFEGSKKQVESVLAWCRKGSPNAVVDHVEVKWQAATGEFDGFKITY